MCHHPPQRCAARTALQQLWAVITMQLLHREHSPPGLRCRNSQARCCAAVRTRMKPRVARQTRRQLCVARQFLRLRSTVSNGSAAACQLLLLLLRELLQHLQLLRRRHRVQQAAFPTIRLLGHQRCWSSFGTPADCRDATTCLRSQRASVHLTPLAVPSSLWVSSPRSMLRSGGCWT